ncbi:MAG TPA: alpha/beta hydrolase [Parvularculaceae bacterium]|nr:alpha/beta hydrolase [Amphiplicatus sp.]MCB9955928.1 alpha/beta hydrolase [Caulobacterales bacterium]HOP18743.1 alpha/beta hydrolase [Amphiplicatus sp.]HPE30878.1 alpha/beta hydrolase [Parvularculaceae bacterium]HRX37805.1 alpha/beta hydrolase [Parvularculaceae bacterium]
MPEVIFAGPEGRLEGRYQKGKGENPPVALILHPHPLFGGTMNNRACYELYNLFGRKGFAILRFNFRGVGRSQGEYDHGQGELADAATALDYLQQLNPNAPFAWVAGFSFGAWIGMQLLMRRPEIAGFISVSAPANLYDFTFLAPCPSSGLVLHGSLDKVCPPEETRTMVDRTRTQKGRKIEFQVIEGADHFFESKVDEMITASEAYLDRRLAHPEPEGPYHE